MDNGFEMNGLLAISATLGVWVAGGSYVYVAGARGRGMRAKRYFLACIFSAAAASVLPLLSEYGMKDILSEFEFVHPAVGFLSVVFFVLSPVVMLPVLALSFFDADKRGAGQKVAGIGLLWGFYFYPPFPLRLADATSVIFPLLFACSAVVFLRVRRRKPDAVKGSVICLAGLVVIYSAFWAHMRARIPDANWSIHELTAAMEKAPATDSYIASTVLKGLGPEGGKEAVPALIRMLGDDERGHLASRTLFEIGLESEGAVQELVRVFEEEKGWGRRRYIKAMSFSSEEEAFAALIRAADDRDASIRGEAVMSLGALTWAGERALRALPGSAWTSGEAEAVKRKGIAEKKKLLLKYDAFSVILRALEDEAENVRTSAHMVLRWYMPEEGAVPAAER